VGNDVNQLGGTKWRLKYFYFYIYGYDLTNLFFQKTFTKCIEIFPSPNGSSHVLCIQTNFSLLSSPPTPYIISCYQVVEKCIQPILELQERKREK
jgi:hypothetical protein